MDRCDVNSWRQAQQIAQNQLIALRDFTLSNCPTKIPSSEDLPPNALGALIDELALQPVPCQTEVRAFCRLGTVTFLQDRRNYFRLLLIQSLQSIDLLLNSLESRPSSELTNQAWRSLIQMGSFPLICSEKEIDFAEILKEAVSHCTLGRSPIHQAFHQALQSPCDFAGQWQEFLHALPDNNPIRTFAGAK